MTPEEHKAVVERQKAIADEAGKKVASAVLEKMDLGEILAKPKISRARFLRTVLKEVDPHFNETLRLGREFFASKFGTSPEGA